VAVVWKGDTYGLINSKGKVLVKTGTYDCIVTFSGITFSDGLAIVEKDGKYGFINTKGKQVVKPTYDSVNPFYNGLAWAEKDGQQMYIDKKGKVIYRWTGQSI
jgi:hypothetical protein